MRWRACAFAGLPKSSSSSRGQSDEEASQLGAGLGPSPSSSAAAQPEPLNTSSSGTKGQQAGAEQGPAPSSQQARPAQALASHERGTAAGDGGQAGAKPTSTALTTITTTTASTGGAAAGGAAAAAAGEGEGGAAPAPEASPPPAKGPFSGFMQRLHDVSQLLSASLYNCLAMLDRWYVRLAAVGAFVLALVSIVVNLVLVPLVNYEMMPGWQVGAGASRDRRGGCGIDRCAVDAAALPFYLASASCCHRCVRLLCVPAKYDQRAVVLLCAWWHVCGM